MNIKDLIGEATEYDKKLVLEEKKPKSWCKSVSAFANTFGGALIFGISDAGKILVIVEIYKGDETPYYYSGDGVLEAFIRVGNESVKATATELKRLVLMRKEYILRFT